MEEKVKWQTVIKPRTSWRDIDLGELWRYRDLIFLFVKRNFATRYKQTVLGPAWILISPLLSTIISTFIFGTVAKIPSDGVPYFLFYMCGNIIWNFFSSSLTSTSTTFVTNAPIFSKVYFPRLVTPISTVITGLLDFGIQLVMFIGFMIYYMCIGAAIAPNIYLLLFPILILEAAILGLGFGIIISSLTTKYRDLTVLVSFGVSLWMYITPVIYSTTTMSAKLRALVLLNPMAPVVETMRYIFLGTGEIPWLYLGISMVVTLVVLIFGAIIFNKVEKTFVDTV